VTGSVVVSGGVARRTDCGGHVWALLQWVLGFRRLGWQVLFLDRLEGAEGARASPEVERFVRVMDGFGLAGHYSLDLGNGAPPVGLDRAEVLRRTEGADLLLNIMGYLRDEEVLARASKRVFLDIDPGFGQMWRALGQCDLFAGHDAFVTVGANVGRDGCRIPACGLDWIPTRPPVVLELWPASEDAGHRFTSVGAWRGPFDPIVYEGETYGLRVHEFRRFAGVPRASGLPFEVALDIDPADQADARLLESGGWSLADPGRVAGGPNAYQRYVRGSRAEFMIAKAMYVRTASGWFSDRTACYLASGRPVVVQDTGIGGDLEAGEGLLTFDTPDEAVEAVRRVDSEWPRHARAARELARRHFDSDVVIDRLVEALAA
jgi:hypothetical protein